MHFTDSELATLMSACIQRRDKMTEWAGEARWRGDHAAEASLNAAGDRAYALAVRIGRVLYPTAAP